MHVWSNSKVVCPEPKRCPVRPRCHEKGVCPKCPPCPRPEACPTPDPCPVRVCPTEEQILKKLTTLSILIVQFVEKLISDPFKQSDPLVTLLNRLGASKWRHYHESFVGFFGHIYLRSTDLRNTISPETILFISQFSDRIYKHLSKGSNSIFVYGKPKFSELNNDLVELLDVIVDHFQNYPNSEIISLKTVEDDMLIIFQNLKELRFTNTFPPYEVMLNVLGKTYDEYPKSVYTSERDSFIRLLVNGYKTFGFPYMNPENFNLQKIAEPGGKEYLESIFAEFYKNIE